MNKYTRWNKVKTNIYDAISNRKWDSLELIYSNSHESKWQARKNEDTFYITLSFDEELNEYTISISVNDYVNPCLEVSTMGSLHYGNALFTSLYYPFYAFFNGYFKGKQR